ncbi:MAG: hypothetical protein AAGE94_20380 [Acidobacteriota bacterium]
MLLFAAPPRIADAARATLDAAFSRYVDALGEAPPSDPDEIAARHEGCRDKVLCAVDAEPGFGADGSLRSFDHTPEAYPFFLVDRPALDDLLARLDRQTRWALDRLTQVEPDNATLDAMRWLAALDRGLDRRRPDDAHTYWESHVQTLRGGLAANLAEDRESVYRALPRSIREKNFNTFSRVWQATADAPDPAPGLQELLDAVLAHTAPDVPPWALLREVVHTTLKQLGLPVAFHVPLTLFAWHRNLVARGLTEAPDGATA